MYQNYIKRFLDVVLSLAGIVVFAPVMLIIAFMVRIRLGSPVIFKQKRPGKSEEIFEMYKFRSMTEQTDATGKLLSDKLRLSSFGKGLRASSLDELPELFNVLKGDMSIVGPRPQLVRDMVFMTPKQRERHCVSPGLTGLAQIKGRNGISWEEKFMWDIKYLQKISFANDLKIVIKTIVKVIKREGIVAPNMETSEDLGKYLILKKEITEEQFQKLLQQSNEILSSKRIDR